MRTNLFLSLALLLIFSMPGLCQEEGCGYRDRNLPDSVLQKIPGYADNKKLIHTLNKLGYEVPEDYFDLLDDKGRYKGEKQKLGKYKKKKDKGNGRTAGVSAGNQLYVPALIHVHRGPNGEDPAGISLNGIEEGFRRLNLVFDVNDVPIKFILQNIVYIHNSNFFNMLNTESAEDAADMIHSFQGYLNIHIVNDLEGGTGTAQGIPGRSLFIDGSFFAGSENLLAHETGHCLGLQHTHHGRCIGDNETCDNCRQESVSRSRTNNCIGFILR